MRFGLAPRRQVLLTHIPPDHTPQTRFWLEDKKRGLNQYFEYFGELAQHLDEYFGELTASKSEIQPGSLTIGQLIIALKPDQFWQVVVAAAFVALVCLGL